MMYVTFTTLKRTAPAQNRGFFGLYEFSDSFVKLGNLNKIKNIFFFLFGEFVCSFPDFIQSDATHIRGTECDQKILSQRESEGKIYSPNYPFPYQTNVVCR